MTTIYFKASWCGFCKEMAPIIAQLQKEGYPIQIVDTDKDKKTAKKYSIKGLPTIVILQGDKEINRIVGGVSIEELRKQLEKPLPDYKVW